MKDFYPIPGYEGIYSISKSGEIYVEKRVIPFGRWGKGNSKTVGGIFRKTHINNLRGGYAEITLNKNGKGTRHKLHRLVAMTFIPNPENLPEVNHIDENKLNNNVENLEWCTRDYNLLYGNSRRNRDNSARNNGKKVFQITKSGEIVAEYRCPMDAHDAVKNIEGFDKLLYQRISMCLNHLNGYKSTGGYRWYFADELLPVKVG